MPTGRLLIVVGQSLCVCVCVCVSVFVCVCVCVSVWSLLVQLETTGILTEPLQKFTRMIFMPS